MKKNIDYYPHKSDSHRHPKFRTLRSLFATPEQGWAAEGRFWALNNLIAQAENCQLDLSKKRNMGVYADELGMSIEEFTAFISVLTSVEIELLTEISQGIFTTEKVQDTFTNVMNERNRNKSKYEKRKKPEDFTDDEVKTNFTTVKEDFTTENLYKVKGSEVKGIEWNGKEVKGSEEELSLETFFSQTTFEELSTLDYDFVRNLYSTHTRIHDPNPETHLKPIAQLLTQTPEVMTKDDIKQCIKEAFARLNSSMGVKVEFLISNIQAKITAKHEEILDKLKKKELAEAEKHRKDSEKQQNEDNLRVEKEKFTFYKNFYERNVDLFTLKEKSQILRYLSENKVFMLGSIIEPKIETASLV